MPVPAGVPAGENARSTLVVMAEQAVWMALKGAWMSATAAEGTPATLL